MRLRQVALVAKDLERSERRLEALLGLDPGYHDPGIIEFGLDNWVAAIGDTFLEVVSPVEENTTAGRYLERRGGDGGYMVIVQVEDLSAARQRLESVGARIVWNAVGEAPSGESTLGLHVHPRDCGGAILSVDQATPAAAWVWAGEGWQEKASQYVRQIDGVELQTEDPEGMAQRWSELLQQSVVEASAPDGGAAWSLRCEGGPFDSSSLPGTVRFVAPRDERGDGVCGVDFLVNSLEEVERRASALDLSCSGVGSVRWVEEGGVRFVFHT
ncbi:MAG: VOC family protein [Acidobacteriota bacterium]